MWGSAVFQWQQTGSNQAAVQKLEIKGNTLIDVANNAGNSNAATAPHFDISTTGSGKIDVVDAEIDSNSYESSSTLHINSTSPIISLNAASTNPWRNLVLRNNRATGFVSGSALTFNMFALGVNQSAPTNLQIDIYEKLTQWALSEAFQLVLATRNSDGAITTATIAWPDGATGVFTGLVLSSAFPGAVDSWSATYVGTNKSLTVTQPTVTRNSDGAVTVQPAPTIA